MANIHEPQFEPEERPAGFRSRRARIGYELATERIGASLWELPPGEAAYPYHFHYADEELIFVLRGSPTLRSPDGLREIPEGEVLHFPVGADGAHQLRNNTDQTITLLAVSSHGRPDVIVYPDSGKLGVGQRLPDSDGIRAFFRRDDEVDYWDGETPPAPQSG
jgi:uncharacterized cupin superfamily protein